MEWGKAYVHQKLNNDNGQQYLSIEAKWEIWKAKVVYSDASGEATKDSGVNGTAESLDNGTVWAEGLAGMAFPGREWGR